MVGNFDDFIGTWNNFVPKILCEDIIDSVEKGFQNSSHLIMNGSKQFENKKIGRYDTSMMLNDIDNELTGKVNEYLNCCLLHYIEEYSQLSTVHLRSYYIKAQKTLPGGAYHVWHYENMTFETSNRELVWAIYLNDMPDNEGETEFLYQKRRIKPSCGTVIIWPAGLTHVHRGLTVYSKDKYILTGWFTKT
jgi:hypothetical protein